MEQLKKCPFGENCDFNEGEIIRFATHQHPFNRIFGDCKAEREEMEECFVICAELRSRIFETMRILARCIKGIDPREIDIIESDAMKISGGVYNKETVPVEKLDDRQSSRASASAERTHSSQKEQPALRLLTELRPQ